MSEHASAFAPGRVNLIGEHTDYNGGLALPFAIDRGVIVRATAMLDEEAIVSVALDLGEEDRFPLRAIDRADGWRAFVRGAAAELRAAGVPVRGARLEITGTAPPGAGLSSSAALAVALCLAIRALAGEEASWDFASAAAHDRTLALARLCSRIENEWAGTHSGLLDQLASLCGVRGRASLIDFRSLNITPIPLDLGGHRLVTLDSRAPRLNARSGYNERRIECERAAALLGVASLRDLTEAQTRDLPEPLNRRARHVLTENGRVLEAVAALRRGDCAALGSLLNASHASLRDDYAVSTPDVEVAVRELLDAGALGARLIGGGFGGHVLGLFAAATPWPAAAVEVHPGGGPRVDRHRS